MHVSNLHGSSSSLPMLGEFKYPENLAAFRSHLLSQWASRLRKAVWSLHLITWPPKINIEKHGFLMKICVFSQPVRMIPFRFCRSYIIKSEKNVRMEWPGPPLALVGNGYWGKPGMVVADSNYGNCWPINHWLMRGGYVKKITWRGVFLMKKVLMEQTPAPDLRSIYHMDRKTWSQCLDNPGKCGSLSIKSNLTHVPQDAATRKPTFLSGT